MLGFLVLAGVVVNNGIVFVDYANQLRDEGMERRQALLQTGRDRIRPILMTALTTVLAMTTMALGIGDGAEMTQPMAIVTIGGLSYATLLTLFVVPVIYDLLAAHRRPPVQLDPDERDALYREKHQTAAADVRGEGANMKPKTVRKPLPGLALIYYLVLAITMARDLASLIETVRFYLENWNVAYQTLAAADLLLRGDRTVAGRDDALVLSHRDPRFQLTLILDIASRLLYLLMAMLLLRTAAPMLRPRWCCRRSGTPTSAFRRSSPRRWHRMYRKNRQKKRRRNPKRNRNPEKCAKKDPSAEGSFFICIIPAVSSSVISSTRSIALSGVVCQLPCR